VALPWRAEAEATGLTYAKALCETRTAWLELVASLDLERACRSTDDYSPTWAGRLLLVLKRRQQAVLSAATRMRKESNHASAAP
jgi:hypothetical protein